jgi:hypothetical protein
MPTINHLIVILQAFFPENLELTRALHVLTILPALYPLMRLHRNQVAQPRQPNETGWMTAIWALIFAAFHPENINPDMWPGEGPGQHAAERVFDHIDNLYHSLGLNTEYDNISSRPMFTVPPIVLTTQHKDCIICPPSIPAKTLRKSGRGTTVRLIGADYKVHDAYLLVASCRTCRSRFYPDRITYRSANSGRLQKLEWDCSYLRISQTGVWVTRDLAFAQEKAIYRFHAGFFNFAEWLNDTNGTKTLTVRQSQKMFTEHFARRLIQGHQMQDTFQCPANPSSNGLAKAVRDAIGQDGGIIPGAMEHECTECTHRKRYASDLVREGAAIGAEGDSNHVAGDDLQDNMVC